MTRAGKKDFFPGSKGQDGGMDPSRRAVDEETGGVGAKMPRSAAFSPAEHLAPISGPLLAVKDVGDVEGEAPHSHGFRPRGVSPGASPVPRSVETGDPLALIADKPQQKLRLRPKLAALSRCHRSSPSKSRVGGGVTPSVRPSN